MKPKLVSDEEKELYIKTVNENRETIPIINANVDKEWINHYWKNWNEHLSSELKALVVAQHCGYRDCITCVDDFYPYLSYSSPQTTSHSRSRKNGLNKTSLTSYKKAKFKYGICSRCHGDVLVSGNFLLSPDVGSVTCSECSINHCHYCGSPDVETYEVYSSPGRVCNQCVTKARSLGKESILFCDLCRKYYSNEEDCPGCFEQRGVQSYSYRPRPIFLHKKKEHLTSGIIPRAPMFFGIEIEANPRSTETPNEHELIKRIKKWGYVKRDGSLSSSHGVEIVSHPGTFEWWNDLNNGFLYQVDKWVQENYVAYWSNSCGIHIHMSRSPFTKLGLGLFVRFIYENREFSEFIAERAGNTYTNFISPLSKWQSIVHDEFIGERYTAVNLNNSNTIEIRMFRSSTKKETIRKNIQFLQALFEFCHSLIGINNFDLAHFLNYIRDYPDRFPELLAFIENEEEGWYKDHPENGKSLVAVASEMSSKANYRKVLEKAREAMSV